jgi:eukaryotic-like serine/threonine-protein kinase
MPAPPRSLKELFLDALAVAPAERSTWLGSECEDRELRRHVELMLAAHDAPQSLLDRPGPPPASPGVVTESSAPAAECPGTTIGSYKLIEPIGEGGMGTVYLAQQQEPVKRLVALKLIKAGMDSAQVIARFEAERQALALMDHPNIAKVFDAGTTEAHGRPSVGLGRPFFAMELVKGVPITRYCDEHHLTPRQRLELFIPVCQAVQHAHQKGIIHRDLKPSNVLVALYDGKPVPKVIDFGVAKAAGQALTEKTLVTGFGAIVGTLEYMSPEQAELNQLDIDTRSDIYSLGVLLYELLAGTTPLERERVNKSGMLEALRIIREDEIPTLSNRLSTTAGLPAIAANRGLEPAKLTKLVRGELDWIVMKALEKDRSRRYETAGGLAMDVQRYLADEAVQACPPSVRYRLRRFARRNKRAVATAAVVGMAVLLAVGGLAVSYARVREALWFEKQVLEHEQQALYLQRVKTAARELAAGNIGRAEQSLDDCPVERHGWEWHFLKRRRYQDPRMLPARDAVLAAAYSPDGRYLAAGCVDGSISLWDTWNWSEPKTLHGHTQHVYSLAFSSNGKYLASGGNDGNVIVWEVSSATPIHTLKGHVATVRQVAFGPGDRLASAGEDRTVRVWDLANEQRTRVFDAHAAPVRGLAFTSAGQAVSVDAGGEVKVWDPESGAVTSSRRGHVRWVSTIAFHSQSGRLALGGWDGAIELWNGPADREPRMLDGHTRHVTGIAFHSDGSRLVSAGDDRALKLWDTTSGQEALTLDVGDITPIGVAFGPDGRHLAVACGQRQVMVCDGTPLSGSERKDELLNFVGHTDLVIRVAFDRDGRRIVSSSQDGTARVWDATTGRRLFEFRGHTGIVSAAVFSPDGTLVASAGWDGKVLVWDPNTGKVIIPLVADEGFVYDVAFSPDGQLLASAHAKGTVILWDSRTGARVHPPIAAHGYEAVSVSFDHDGQRLATAGGRGHSAKVWDVQTGKLRVPVDLAATDRGSSRVRQIAFSPDGRWLATVGHGNVKSSCVMIWDAATGKHSRTIEGSGRRLFHVAYSQVGGWIAACGQDEAVFVWDAATDKERFVGRGHAGEVQCVAFSPDGRLLASCGGYKGRGEIKVWDSTRWKQE